MKYIFLANLAATLFMIGVIWVIQVVHYPLFRNVGVEGFADYERLHSNLITLIVGPPMLLELATALLLLWQRPTAMPTWMAWIGVILVGVIWLSTAFLQVPQHTFLSAGFNAEAHRLLVTTNWIRTIAWSLRGGLLLWVAAKGMVLIAT